MSSKSCCRQHHDPRQDRESGVHRRLLASLAAGLIFHAPAVVFGHAPQWMHAQANAVLTEHDRSDVAAALYAEQVVSVSDGRIDRLDRGVIKILRPEGERYGVISTVFDSQSPIRAIRAWCIPESGPDRDVSDRDAVDGGFPGAELITDLRVRQLRVPGATPGSIVGYEREQLQRAPNLIYVWQFQNLIPTRETRLTLELPRGWSFRVTWLNHAEEAPVALSPTAWQWTLTDVHPVHQEPHMPPLASVAGQLVITLLPPPGQKAPNQSWADIGHWYSDLTRGRRDPSTQIKQKVQELTAGTSAIIQKMQLLSRFVQGQIRYVAIELGIGGYQPHSAAEVFAHGYGDCKDKATLLSSMLKEIGIEADYVIINASRGIVTSASPPSLEFNHVILAIHLPDGVDDPAFQAVVVHPKLGRLLFFDPTDPLVPLGSLRGSLQGNYGLLVTAQSGELMALPQSSPDANGFHRSAKLSLAADGTLSGSVDETWTGDHGVEQRRMIRSRTQASDQIREVEAQLGQSLATVRILKAGMGNVLDIDKPFIWSYSIEADNYAKAAGDLLLVRPRVFGSETEGFLETPESRQLPIQFDAREHDTDVFDISLPSGYTVDELPPPANADYGFASYHSHTELVGNVLHYARELVIKEADVPAASADQLKVLYRVITNDERMTAVLKRAQQ